MLQGRSLCKISLLIVIVIALSAYGPYDFLGLYGASEAVDMFLTDGDSVCSTGQIYRKEIKNNQTQYFIKDAQVITDRGTLSDISYTFNFDSDSFPIKSKIKLKGAISKFQEPRNQGEFNIKDYYNSIGVYFQFKDVEVIDVYEPQLLDYDFFYRLNRSVVNLYSRIFAPTEAGVLSSIVAGNKSELDGEIRSLFQGVGLAHILAVSGLHVSIVCMLLYKLLRRLGISFLLSSIFAGAVALAYGIFTGGSISSIRAIGMFLFYLLAQVLGESYDMLTAAGAMAIILLVTNPLYIKNGSFLLSFGAILSIWYIAIPLNKSFMMFRKEQINRWNLRGHSHGRMGDIFLKTINKLIDYIGGTLIFSFGINVGILPLLVMLYHEVPRYSLILNILILPVMPFLLLLGIAGGIMGILVGIGIAEIILKPCHFLIMYMEAISEFFWGLQHSKMIVGAHGFMFIVVYYLLVILLVRYKNRLIRYIGLSGIYLMWLIPFNGGFEIDFLDVGQGDGIYVNSGDGIHYFIDGGSTSKSKVGEYTILPFLKYKGVSSIDYWFLSHMDEDHVSGVFELLEQDYKIENIVLSAEIPKDDTLVELIGFAEKKGTEILYMNSGDVLGSKHLRFTCVYPNDSAAVHLSSDGEIDLNALSLCLLMEYDRDGDEVCDYAGFFGGDISSEQETIIADMGLVEDVDLLKVSHHGSRFSSDASFLEALSPKTAVISCSK
ncbi:MAG: DNA internalization-related competence protein ComEC/Rec2, partial [Pseudobutyrivibrio sp.]|nr:DNA internalization-related competence protein ComEC/Rec2 [Pseudobutyrivibrio sp.]